MKPIELFTYHPNVIKKYRSQFKYILVDEYQDTNKAQCEIVKLLGNPIVSTSIHDEDEVIEYSTDPELIFEKWETKVDLVIDGGYGDNIASTIIDLTGYEPEVIREGKGGLDIL